MHSGVIVVWLKDPKGIDSKKLLAGIHQAAEIGDFLASGEKVSGHKGDHPFFDNEFACTMVRVITSPKSLLMHSRVTRAESLGEGAARTLPTSKRKKHREEKSLGITSANGF